MDQRVIIFLLVIWAKAEASNTTSSSSWPVVLKVFENCIDKNDSLSCLQQKVLNFAKRMAKSKTLEVFEGFKFTRDEPTGRTMNDLESNNSTASLSDQIWDNVGTFFNTHSVEVNIRNFLDTDNEARKKKGGKGYGGILLLAGAAKGAMIYMGLHALAALAGKALLVAKVALTIASVIALKKLLEGNGGKTSYEIIKHPQHSYVQTHSSSHEYGGGGHGGHGGGYEGHYRKRSIAKPKINVDDRSALTPELTKASDLWKFELPNKHFRRTFATSSNVPNNSQRTINDAPNQGELFSYKQAADGTKSAAINRDSFAGEVDGKNGLLQSEERSTLSNDNAFSSLRLRRSLLTKFA